MDMRPLSQEHKNCQVTLPDGSYIHPMGEATLHFYDDLTLNALVMKDLSENLASIGNFIDKYDASVLYTKSGSTYSVPGHNAITYPRSAGQLFELPMSLSLKQQPVSFLAKKYESKNEQVQWLWATFGFSNYDRFVDCHSKGFFVTPGITTEDLKRHPQTHPAHDAGYMQQTPPRRKPKPDSKTPAQVYTAIYRRSNNGDCFVDATGRFPSPLDGNQGGEYLVVFYNQDENYARLVVMPDRTKESWIKAYKDATEFFIGKKCAPLNFYSDNEHSNLLQTWLANNGYDWRYAPPNQHRANIAERIFGQLKPLIIAMMAGADPRFPVELMGKIVPQAELIFNLLRESGRSPLNSAYHGVYGEQFNLAQYPMAPVGTFVMAHIKPEVRGTWSAHAEPGWYMGTPLRNHRCFNVYMQSTRAMRVTDTLQFHTDKYKVPMITHAQQLTAAVESFTAILQRWQQHSNLPADAQVVLKDTSTSIINNFLQLCDIYAPPEIIGERADAPVPNATPAAAPAPVQRVNPPLATPSPHLSAPATTAAAAPQTPAAVVLVLNPNPQMGPEDNYGQIAQEAGPLALPPQTHPVAPQRVNNESATAAGERVQAEKAAAKAARKLANLKIKEKRAIAAAAKAQKEAEAAAEDAKSFKQVREGRTKAENEKADQRAARSKKTPSRYALHAQARSATGPFIEYTRIARRLKENRNWHGWGVADASKQRKLVISAHMAIAHFQAPTLGRNTAATPSDYDYTAYATSLSFKQAMTGPDKERWLKAHDEEIKRLINDTKTMHPIQDDGRAAVYYSPQCKIKSDGQLRVRGTYGGDRHPGDLGDRTAHTAPMEAIKLLFAATASDKAKYGKEVGALVVDVKDAYLNSILEKKAYMRIKLDQLSPQTISDYNLQAISKNGSVLFEIEKGIYGHPEAGRLWQRELIDNCLKPAGFFPLPSSPCLFSNKEKTVVFSLVVDDFFIKYRTRAAADPLLKALEARYTITKDETASKYLGLTITWEANNAVSVSLPGYIDALTTRLKFTSELQHHSPACVAELSRKTYSRGPQMAEVDSSAALNEADTLFVQIVLGALLYYSRAVDSTMLTAINHIATTGFTEKALAAATYLLIYAKTHPTAHVRFRASDMVARAQCDASFNGRSKGRSTQGGLIYLGDADHPEEINGAVECFSSIISVVVASAAEAEYAALFQTARSLLPIRQLLIELGYDQPSSHIFCDNAVAVKLANDDIAEKRSKTFDNRFHWIRDRIRQGQFIVLWRKGTQNLADIFTKLLPVSAHQRLAQHLVWYGPRVNKSSRQGPPAAAPPNYTANFLLPQ